MSMQKRALASSSSGQPSQPKRLCHAPIDQIWNGSERNLVPMICLTEEDVRRVFREELELAKPHWAEYCQSYTGNALADIGQQMRSLVNAFQKLKEAVEPANIHSFHLGRANANLRLQLQTKLSLPLFTGKKLEGEGRARIYVALIDTKTGDVVTSGPESSIKLDIVVLEGDFNKNDEENWTKEEFENYVVKQREGKRPLLTGNLQVTLKEGVGQLGELIFTDNSSWNRSKSFRIGLTVASGYCGNTRIQEGITDAFPVKEHRGESYRKHHPPAFDDEVWRLEKIAKDGKSHKKLSEAGIYKVEDFLLQLFTDSQKLREILGKSIIPKNWDILIDHAKTCQTNWKLYLYYSDGMRKHGVVFNTNGQLIGLIKDGVSFATHRLSDQEKDYGDTIVEKALYNWNDVREFNGETCSCSMQKNVGSSAEGHNVVTALALPGQSPNTGDNMEFSFEDILCLAEDQPMFTDGSNVVISPGDNGTSTVGLPILSCNTIGSSSQMHTGNETVLSSEPSSHASISSVQSSSTLPLLEENHMMEHFHLTYSDDISKDCFAGNPRCDDTFFQTPQYGDGFIRGTSKGVNGWLKIKAVMQWGIFVRKRGVRIVQLDEPPIEVEA